MTHHYASITSIHGWFLSPLRFLACKAEWSALRNFTLVLFPWSHQATGPVLLDTAAYLWFGWIIHRTPRIPLWCPYGHRTGPVWESSMFFIPYGTRAWPTRVPYGALTDTKGNWHNHNWQKSCTGVIFGHTGPVRAPYGPHMGCLQSLNPYGARNLIMHALKLYGPRTGRQNSYGVARGSYGLHEWTYDFCSKQPGNCPYGARECYVTEA